MKKGICPKCSGTEVYRQDASPRSSDRVTLKEGLIGKDASMVAKYVCTGCGYLEYYLPDVEDTSYVAEHWERVKTSSRA